MKPTARSLRCYPRLRGHLSLRRHLTALLAAAACQACFAKEPAREAAPPPPAAAPEAPPPAPAEAPAPEPTSAEPSRPSSGAVPESKKAAPSVNAPRPAPAGAGAPRQRREAQSVDRDDSAAEVEEEEAAPRKSEVGSAERLMQRLGTAVNLATPDCPSARDRKRAICDLASQICRLVDNDPNVASVVEYCSDARRRCSEAEQRIAERCE